jgi:hypothetical protein
MDSSPGLALTLRIGQAISTCFGICCVDGSHSLVYVLGGVLQIEKLARIPEDLAILQYYIRVPRAVQVNLVTVSMDRCERGLIVGCNWLSVLDSHSVRSAFL